MKGLCAVLIWENLGLLSSVNKLLSKPEKNLVPKVEEEFKC